MNSKPKVQGDSKANCTSETNVWAMSVNYRVPRTLEDLGVQGWGFRGLGV